MSENLEGLKIRVKTVSKGGQYKDIIGLVGVVERNGSTYGIRFNELENMSGHTGLFWLAHWEFDIISDEEYNQEKCEMLDGYYIVKVNGRYTKTYNYKCRFDVNIGDKVVCEGEDYIQTVVGIYNRETASFKNPTKEVVCVIDYSKLQERREKERKAKEVEDKLKSEIVKIREEIDYEYYAKKSETVALLLKELEELKGE